MHWLIVTGLVLRNAAIYATLWILGFIAVILAVPAIVEMGNTRNELIEAIEGYVDSPDEAKGECMTPSSHYSSTDVEQDRYYPLRV